MSTKLSEARWPWICAGILGALLVLFQFVDVRSGDTRPVGDVRDVEALAQRDDVSVIFILIDTLRAHRVGSYGYERDTSPVLDYLAGSGVRFARHLAQSSWTKCSMASLWTGLNPDRTGVRRYDDALPEQALLPAEILRAAGFRTSGIYRNGWVAPNFGFHQGFELYDRPAPDVEAATLRRRNPHITLQGTDNATIDAAIEFLRAQGDQRFLLYLHLMDVHQYIYDASSALFGTTYSDVYDNAIRHEDAMLGRLFAYLSENGFLDRTLIAIASDHGEAFLERGYEGHARHVFRESTEVPFILSLPFRLEPGAVLEARSRNIDVWPTLLDLLGLPPLEEADGRSLVPELLASLRGEPASDASRRGIAYLDRTWGRPGQPTRPAVAVTEGQHRFVHSVEEEGETIEQLFDAGSDPGELENVIAERPELAATLRAEAERFLASKGTPWGTGETKVEVDEMQLNQLRALGYQIE